MANSGGGVILIGVNDDGSISNANVSPVLSYDPADLTNKMFSYTGRHFSAFKITPVQKSGMTIAAIQIGRISIPLVFTSPGNYQGRDGKPKCAFSSGTVYFRHGAKSHGVFQEHCVSIPLVFTSPGNYQGRDGKPKCAFSSGTVYFRHGAKSGPCTSEDLHNFLKREIELVKESWLSGIRKVVEAPEGSQVLVFPAGDLPSADGSLQAIRIVDDPSVPAYQLLDPNKTHPYRQTDVVREFNKRLMNGKEIKTYDVQCIKHAHRIEEHPRFFYKPLHNSPQYSVEFVEWLIRQYQEDEKFFDKARNIMHEIKIEQNNAKGRNKYRIKQIPDA